VPSTSGGGGSLASGNDEAGPTGLVTADAAVLVVPGGLVDGTVCGADESTSVVVVAAAGTVKENEPLIGCAS
jgi:hypothetical protein